MNNVDPTISCDFIKDWRDWVVSRLTALDPSLDDSLDVSELCYRFVNVLQRRISQVPRIVFRSRELNCPGHLNAGFQTLIPFLPLRPCFPISPDV
jgi:hypothetical protein